MTNYDDLKLAIESQSGGTNTVLLDDLGMPSIMVKIPKFKVSDVIAGGSGAVHPAFIVNGVEKDFIYISKYQNVVQNSRAYSLAGKDPAVNINFDTAWNYCKNKGKGWHLMTNAEWAAIALWCKKNGTMPNGNNNYGRDVSEADLPQKALPTHMDGAKIGRTATGSGRTSWNHDNTPFGIADLNGNVWERNSGLRLQNGEIQILANNNAADTNNSVSSTSTSWKAILSDGTLVDSGTTGTLKFDYLSNKITLCAGTVTDTSGASREAVFESLALDESVTSVPEIIKSLCLYPAETGYSGDMVYMNMAGERLLLHGGRWANAAVAGVFSLSLAFQRSNSVDNVGFRSAYVDL